MKALLPLSVVADVKVTKDVVQAAAGNRQSRSWRCFSTSVEKRSRFLRMYWRLQQGRGIYVKMMLTLVLNRRGEGI